jgi:hypothetical protein
MDASWVGIAVTLAAGAVAGFWAVYTWRKLRSDDQRRTQDSLETLFANPMLFVTDDLQSRLYNVLDDGGLVPLSARYSDGWHAEETLYLVARYFAWEQILLRFTRFGADPEVLGRTRAVREVLASDRGGLDASCMFRPVQSALGQAVTVWRPEVGGFADTKSVVQFDEQLQDGLAARLHLDELLLVLRNASSADELPARTRQRLADVQACLVSLLEYLEADIARSRRLPFRVGVEQRRRCRMATGPDHETPPSERSH